jgi:hypothetical protein
LTLSVIDRDAIPTTRRGGSTTRLTDAEQDMLRKVAGTGELVSDGKVYPTAKAARSAAGQYRRFLRRLVNDGDATGKVATRTWLDGKKYRWAVGVRANG